MKTTYALLILGVVVLGGWAVISHKGTSSAETPKEQIHSVSRAEQSLIDEGYTDIQHKSVPWFKCAESDNFFLSETFTAKTPAGKEVEVTACCAFLKGCTVRH